MCYSVHQTRHHHPQAPKDYRSLQLGPHQIPLGRPCTLRQLETCLAASWLYSRRLYHWRSLSLRLFRHLHLNQQSCMRCVVLKGVQARNRHDRTATFEKTNLALKESRTTEARDFNNQKMSELRRRTIAFQELDTHLLWNEGSTTKYLPHFESRMLQTDDNKTAYFADLQSQVRLLQESKNT